jgi:hypothetical protein
MQLKACWFIQSSGHVINSLHRYQGPSTNPFLLSTHHNEHLPSNEVRRWTSRGLIYSITLINCTHHPVEWVQTSTWHFHHEHGHLSLKLSPTAIQYMIQTYPISGSSVYACCYVNSKVRYPTAILQNILSIETNVGFAAITSQSTKTL